MIYNKPQRASGLEARLEALERWAEDISERLNVDSDRLESELSNIREEVKRNAEQQTV